MVLTASKTLLLSAGLIGSLSLGTDWGSGNADDTVEKNSPTPAVYNQTTSPFGRAFAQTLARRWRQTGFAEQHRLVIREGEAPQAGTYLWVLLDGAIVYRLFPVPQQQSVEVPVSAALQAVRAKLLPLPPGSGAN